MTDASDWTRELFIELLYNAGAGVRRRSHVVLDERHVDVEQHLQHRQVEPARLCVQRSRTEGVDAHDAHAHAKVLRVWEDGEGEACHPGHGHAQPVAVVDARLADGAVDGDVEALAEEHPVHQAHPLES